MLLGELPHQAMLERFSLQQYAPIVQVSTDPVRGTSLGQRFALLICNAWLHFLSTPYLSSDSQAAKLEDVQLCSMLGFQLISLFMKLCTFCSGAIPVYILILKSINEVRAHSYFSP